MTNRDLLNAMGKIDPKLISDAAPKKLQKKTKTEDYPEPENGISIRVSDSRTFPWKTFISSAACAAAVLFGVFIIKGIIPVNSGENSESYGYSANSAEQDPSDGQSHDNSENSNDIIISDVYDFENYDISETESKILSIKTTEGTIEHTFKKIMLHAKTLGEMVDDLQRSKYYDRITEVEFMVGVKSIPYYYYTFKDGEWSFRGNNDNGPIDIEYTDEQIREIDIIEKMMIFVRYDEDKWVRYFVSFHFDWHEENLYNYTEEFTIAVEQIIKTSETVEEMLQAIREIDRYDLASEIAVYKDKLDYINNAEPITEGKLIPGMKIIIYSPRGGSSEYTYYFNGVIAGTTID